MAKIKKVVKNLAQSLGYLKATLNNDFGSRTISYHIPGFLNTSGGYHDICIDSSNGMLCLAAYNTVGVGKIAVVDKESREYRIFGDCPVNYQIGSRCVVLEAEGFSAVLSSTIHPQSPYKPDSTLFDFNGRVLNRFPYDFIDVCESSGEAVSVDFRHIWENRQGYGFKREFSDRSVSVTNLFTGRRELSLAIDSDFNFLHPHAESFLNHIKFSPNGNFIFGFISENFPIRKNKCWIFDRRNQKFLLDENWRQFEIISHHCWLSDFEFLFFGFRKNGYNGYFILNIETQIFTEYCPKIRVDGHPTGYGAGIITDCYPSILGLQSMWAVRADNVRLLGRVFSRRGPGDADRCDLHPKLSRSKRSVFFDKFTGFSCSKRVLCETLLDA